MSKIYQPTKNNPYRLRERVYNSVVYLIRDVARVDSGYFDNEYLWKYKPSEDQIEAVNTALQEIPEEYRTMVFNNVSFDTAWPSGYRNKATSLEKAKFIYRVAELLGYELGPKVITHVEYDWR